MWMGASRLPGCGVDLSVSLSPEQINGRMNASEVFIQKT